MAWFGFEKKFIKIFNACFDFLIDKYGFKFIRVENEGLFLKIVYKNKSTGLVVSYDRREGVFLYLVVLEGEDVGKYTNKRWFLVEKLLKVAGEDGVFDNPKRVSFGSYSYIKSSLEQYALVLKKHGHSVLLGDFSSLR